MEKTPDEKTKRPRRNREAVTALLAEYRESGLTQRAYAAQAGVSLSSLVRWLHGKSGGGAITQTGFAAVRLGPEPTETAAVTIRWPEGMEVLLPLSLGEATLRRWLGDLVPCSR